MKSAKLFELCYTYRSITTFHVPHHRANRTTHCLFSEWPWVFTIRKRSKQTRGGIRLAFPRKEHPVSDFIAARKIGEKISFTRNDVFVVGTIHKILENSVIVEISEEDADLIGAASTLTVVAHKNYTVE